jgi:hypothetical protein
MNGTDLGALAQKFTTYFGGAAGGYMLAAALIIVSLLSAAHVLPGRAALHPLILGCLAWTAAYIVSTVMGWA